MFITVSEKPIESTQMLKKSIEEYCKLKGESFAEYAVHKTEGGKPYVEGNPFYISLSHSAGITVAAVSDTPCGIDIEYMKERDYQKIAKRFFQTMPAGLNEFYRLWTAKEAYKKMSDIPLVDALKTDISDAVHLPFIQNYSLTVIGKGTPVIIIIF